MRARGNTRCQTSPEVFFHKVYLHLVFKDVLWYCIELHFNNNSVNDNKDYYLFVMSITKQNTFWANFSIKCVTATVACGAVSGETDNNPRRAVPSSHLQSWRHKKNEDSLTKLAPRSTNDEMTMDRLRLILTITIYILLFTIYLHLLTIYTVLFTIYKINYPSEHGT